MKTKEWLCGSGQHAIGVVVWNGNNVPQLELVLQKPEAPFGSVIITGRAVIICPDCGTTRLWDISVEALVEIFRHLDAGQIFEFSKRLLEKN